ncbi:hypothetical protein MTR67_022293 [Solanum verrucosum]|uniref:Uncharacterized protein n=1 Tax=Solanum verrucosum TaxID=315347 RepID=A0AAF0QV40_SOLVR|nr:hypothetical protein MTR67_022293 [Solanum verrucosum]
MAKKPINVKNVSSSGEESTSDMMSSRSKQVASHAQKYFDRQKEKRAIKRKKSSVFDINNLNQESSNTCPELVSKRENKKKGKQVLNEESPISAMPISYILPPNGSYAYAYLPMNNYQFNFVTSSTPLVHQPSSQSSSASMDDLDLTLAIYSRYTILDLFSDVKVLSYPNLILQKDSLSRLALCLAICFRVGFSTLQLCWLVKSHSV